MRTLIQGSDRISRGYFAEYLLGRPDVQVEWQRFVNHPFVMGLGDGTLPLESFKKYIMQDYIFLVRAEL
jgi:hydroxymethylpyrimidine/phosphomethylpyrimidine kinase